MVKKGIYTTTSMGKPTSKPTIATLKANQANLGIQPVRISGAVTCSANRGVDHAAQNLLNVLRAAANDNPTANVTYTAFHLSSNCTENTSLKDCIDSLNNVLYLVMGVMRV